MLRFTAALIGAVAFAGAMTADTIGNYFAGELVQNAAARQHLQLGDDATSADFSKTSLTKADINGDGAADYIFTAVKDKSSVIAAWTARIGGTYESAQYVGFEPMDCTTTPKVRSLDVTGDGSQELHIEGTRTFTTGSTVRTLKFVKFSNNQLVTVFSALLDGTEQNDATFTRSTHMVKVIDTDGDGKNEIQVESRRVDMLKTRFGERELSRSVLASTSTYAFNGNGYEISSENITKQPSAEDKIAVANELYAAGELTRASAIAEALIASEDTSDAVILSANRLLKDYSGSDDVVTTAAGKSYQG